MGLERIEDIHAPAAHGLLTAFTPVFQHKHRHIPEHGAWNP